MCKIKNLQLQMGSQPHTHSWANPFPVVRGTLPWEHHIGNINGNTHSVHPWEYPREHPFSTSIGNITLGTPIQYIHWEHHIGNTHSVHPLGTSAGTPIQYIHWEHPQEHPFSTSIGNIRRNTHSVHPLGTSTGTSIDYIHWEHSRERPSGTSIFLINIGNLHENGHMNTR